MPHPGDFGLTTLCDGEQLPKNDPRIEILGALDELQAQVFLALAKKPKNAALLKQITKDLHDILAAIADQKDLKTAEKTAALDRYIENAAKQSGFRVFDQNEKSALLNLARTVCRRAERRLLVLDEKTPPNILAYLNRLSLALFYLASAESKRTTLQSAPK